MASNSFFLIIFLFLDSLLVVGYVHVSTDFKRQVTLYAKIF